MKQLIFLITILGFTSCIPLRIAPTIKTDKVMVAKKFKRKLSKQYAFIFEDPKDANEFYNYVNTKYELYHQDVEWNVPFEIDGEQFFFSFSETEIQDKTLNLLPLVADAALDSKGYGPLFDNIYTSRTGNWYILIGVSDNDLNDCLKPDYFYREKVLKYLRSLRKEYLNTQNYLEALLRK